ncbi:phage tail tube protein [Turicimonas muris]|uniref:phage tail tube protein n=1 Tax=Turicimonas muris TaxID=1796652 RepID=UPI001EC21C19|nr:phage tail tube protein [Turicimonas muris]MBS4847110.1 phage tail tube protein [Burkholderiales bacterium]
MAKLIAGVCYITMNGKRLLLKGAATATASDFSREAVMANGRVSGYKETPVVPTISGQFVVDKDFPIDELKTATDMTVVLEFANGLIFTLGGAFVTDAVEVSGDDSDTTINFAGETGKWKQ